VGFGHRASFRRLRVRAALCPLYTTRFFTFPASGVHLLCPLDSSVVSLLSRWLKNARPLLTKAMCEATPRPQGLSFSEQIKRLSDNDTETPTTSPTTACGRESSQTLSSTPSPWNQYIPS